MYDIIAILIPIVLAICIVYIIRIVTDSRLRRHLADMETDLETVKVILQSDRNSRNEAVLRWGTLSLSLGTAMVFIQVFGLGSQDALSYGMLFMATGLGLIITRILNR